MISFWAEGFTLLLEVEDEKAVITGYKGGGAKLSIPAVVNDNGKDYPVCSIMKKAFLGCNGLREVYVPDSVTLIDDWGFAQCLHLIKVRVGKNIVFGKNIFEGSSRISEIYSGECEEGLARLLAAAVNGLPASFLFRDSDIGTDAWYSRWDLGLKAFLMQDDTEGYSDRALCGEEDISYDGIGSVDGEMLGETAAYIRQIGKEKCRLVLLRLMHRENLSEEMLELLNKYILDHSLGHGNEAAWWALKEDHRDDLDYLKLYIDIVNPDEKGIDLMIQDMGNDMAQAKAYLIKLNKKENKTAVFFDMLEL